MQFVTVGDTFDGGDFFVLDFHSERQTGANGLVVHHDRAGGAGTATADQFGAGEVESFAQGIDEDFVGARESLVAAVVDGKGDGHLVGAVHGSGGGRKFTRKAFSADDHAGGGESGAAQEVTAREAFFAGGFVFFFFHKDG